MTEVSNDALKWSQTSKDPDRWIASASHGRSYILSQGKTEWLWRPVGGGWQSGSASFEDAKAVVQAFEAAQLPPDPVQSYGNR